MAKSVIVNGRESVCVWGGWRGGAAGLVGRHHPR